MKVQYREQFLGDYDALPYTYVLGVSDKWIRKFETISLRAPDWYDSPSGFASLCFFALWNRNWY